MNSQLPWHSIFSLIFVTYLYFKGKFVTNTETASFLKAGHKEKMKFGSEQFAGPAGHVM